MSELKKCILCVMLIAALCFGCSLDPQEKVDNQSKAPDRVNNGTITLSYPEVGALFTVVPGVPFGSGVLVAPDVILTCNHVDALLVNTFIVNYVAPVRIVGEYQVPGSALENGTNDLAVNINSPAIYGITPATIKSTVSANSDAILVGYGMDFWHAQYVPGIKRSGHVNVSGVGGNYFTLFDNESFLWFNWSHFGLPADSGGGVYDSNSGLLEGIMYGTDYAHTTWAHNLGNSYIQQQINYIMQKAYSAGVRSQYNYNNWPTLRVR